MILIQKETAQAFLRERSGNAIARLVLKPGEGKSGFIDSILSGLEADGLSYRVASPTGKGAKRMLEVGLAAQTVHALIAANAPTVDVLVVMDGEMLTPADCAAFPRLARRTVFVVDDNWEQRLPPIGAGSVLEDLRADAAQRKVLASSYT